MIVVGTPVHGRSVHNLEALLQIWSTWDIPCHFLEVFNGQLVPPTISRMNALCRAYQQLSIQTHVMPTGYCVGYDALTRAQNFIRHVALTGNYSHLLLNEVTRVPTQQSLNALLSADKPVSGALYRDSHKPGYYCVYEFDGTRHRFDGYRSIDRITDVTCVKGMGFGFVLIARRVLRLRQFRSARYASDTYFGCDMSEIGVPLYVCPTIVGNCKVDRNPARLARWHALRQRIMLLPRYGDQRSRDPLGDLDAESEELTASTVARVEEDVVAAAAGGDGVALTRLLDERPTLLAELTTAGCSYGPGYTLLHVAAGHGQAAIVKLLLNLGMDVGARGGHWRDTALHWVSQFGCMKTAALLIEAGADPVCRNALGMTPIQVAHWFDHRELMGLLVRAATERVRHP
jgi:hypothetical protein